MEDNAVGFNDGYRFFRGTIAGRYVFFLGIQGEAPRASLAMWHH